MTTPEQPRHDDHDRPTGGVRGAINDLLGRGDHPDDGHRVEDERLAHEPAGAGPGPGQQPPAGARFEGQHIDQQPVEQQRVGQQPVEQQPGAVGAAAPHQQGVADRRPDDLFDAPATPGSARHSDVGPDGPGYAAPEAHPGTGRADPDGGRTRDPAAAPRPASVADTSRGEDAEGRERLVTTERATSYASRWDAVKGGFVDEPRQAVADADALVGDLLDELQALFTEQRRGIERGLAADETSTEDMRLALRRYRSFFDRLLSI